MTKASTSFQQRSLSGGGQTFLPVPTLLRALPASDSGDHSMDKSHTHK